MDLYGFTVFVVVTLNFEKSENLVKTPNSAP